MFEWNEKSQTKKQTNNYHEKLQIDIIIFQFHKIVELEKLGN